MSEVIPSRLKLRVITPLRLLVDEEVQEVALPSLEGLIGILPGHRPLLVALGEGVLSYTLAGQEKEYQVIGGYAKIDFDFVLVFTRLNEEDEQESDEGWE
jgi:F-type H+-transporting ATPase subunit epsilon